MSYLFLKNFYIKKFGRDGDRIVGHIDFKVFSDQNPTINKCRHTYFLTSILYHNAFIMSTLFSKILNNIIQIWVELVCFIIIQNYVPIIKTFVYV